ncbi:hypothetical protein LC613_32625 [Nostoc sphaeroides CHAB 2801]|uniref:hypothetical protein n=1 Tax=Nostoc sphaeroides TaxID=446679 RepID=UPI001E3FF0BE|nr:hypothetical protein [Nostoc sphaeroides]MCC5632379.1 hypothetical protein [Nostoc sphaeroides CHAB 2801]
MVTHNFEGLAIVSRQEFWRSPSIDIAPSPNPNVKDRYFVYHIRDGESGNPVLSGIKAN